MSSGRPPRIIIIAGPNGAGKTTFAREFLPNEAACLQFVNADLIAAGLSPFAPEAAALQAGRLMLTQISNHVAHRRSFALETTLSAMALSGMGGAAGQDAVHSARRTLRKTCTGANLK